MPFTFFMTATGHALLGALVAAKFGNPAIALPVSFASHFVADYIPHWDPGTNWRKKSRHQLFQEAAVDVVLSVIAAFYVYHTFLGQSNYLLLYGSVFAAQLPDWLTAPEFIFGIKIPELKLMYRIQHRLNRRLDLPWGIVSQVVTVVLAYIVLFRLGI